VTGVQTCALPIYDELTKLSNRFSFLEKLEWYIEQATQNSEIIGLLYIDLDRFKLINDTLGHAAGDDLLQSVSRVLMQSVKNKDVVARIGGDEFVILLTDLKSDKDAFSVAKGIHDALMKPHQIAGKEMIVTSSVGVSVFPTDAKCAEDLINNADRAMYRVKGKGKNAVLKFIPLQSPEFDQRLDDEAKLRQVIEANSEIEIYYQPQLNAKENRIVGVEALVRWNHPEKGLLYPIDFIPLAEEIGIIEQMGEWVLASVLMQRKQWATCGFEAIRVSVNVCHGEFVHTDFRKMLLDTVGETDLSSGWLELELTENIILEDRDSSIQLLQDLRAMGIELAMDDFGTGYSSLSYLKRLPIDEIKIDRSFVSELNEDVNDQVMVRSILNVAKQFKLTSVAEGVETEDQFNILRYDQCEFYQVYYFSKPLIDEDFRTFYKK